jgi:hypothetical protein
LTFEQPPLFRLSSRFAPPGRLSIVEGVPHAASFASSESIRIALPLPRSFATGACQHAAPPEALPPVRSADAARSKYRLPEVVAFRFQVSLNKVEPVVSNRSINLLSKDNWRAALPDEAVKFWPEVTRVVKAPSLPGAGEGGARAASCPYPLKFGNTGVLESQGEPSDSCEEVALVIAGHIFGCDITD